MRYTFSVMPVDAEHLRERCEDIRRQKREGIAEIPLFMCKLIPKCDPVRDTAGEYAAVLARYREELKDQNIGILAQSTIGHEWPPVGEPAPYQRVISLETGEVQDCYCPADPGLREYFFRAFRTLAELHPAVIMVDDDVRLLSRACGGCVCPRHMQDLARRTGREWDREELKGYLASHPSDDPVWEAYRASQTGSLLGCVEEMRRGIDSVDPTVQGAACVNYLGRETPEYAPIIAGRGNPVIMRLTNGTYAPAGVLNFSDPMRRVAAGRQQFGSVADVLISEEDTIPYNRYGKSARYVHAHYAAALADGLQGAKHWITRLDEFSPESGEAYRRILAHNRGLYEKLQEIAPELRPLGCRIPLPEKAPLRCGDGHFAANVLERMGLPLYFSAESGGAVFASGPLDQWFSDEELEKMLRDPTFFSADAAESLCRRGFGSRLGVEVGELVGAACAGEEYDAGDRCEPPVGARRLTLRDGEAASVIFRETPDGREPICPGTAVHSDGGTLRVTFCGTPRTNHTYFEAFAFLNAARKRQLADLLRRCGQLPVWYEGDAQVLLRAWRMADGRLLVYFLNTGIDPLPEIPLNVSGAVSRVTALTCEGREEPVLFRRDGECVIAERKAEMMDPQFMILEVE